MTLQDKFKRKKEELGRQFEELERKLESEIAKAYQQNRNRQLNSSFDRFSPKRTHSPSSPVHTEAWRY
jgi:phage shock protein A